MNQTSKIEPFVLMSKSAKGAAAAKLVQDATSAPGLFVFAELLDVPNIQEVCRTVYQLHDHMLTNNSIAREQLNTRFILFPPATLRLQDLPGLHPCVATYPLSNHFF